MAKVIDGCYWVTNLALGVIMGCGLRIYRSLVSNDVLKGIFLLEYVKTRMFISLDLHRVVQWLSNFSELDTLKQYHQFHDTTGIF
jgi:hypothetical protein